MLEILRDTVWSLTWVILTWVLEYSMPEKLVTAVLCSVNALSQLSVPSCTQKSFHMSCLFRVHFSSSVIVPWMCLRPGVSVVFTAVAEFIEPRYPWKEKNINYFSGLKRLDFFLHLYACLLDLYLTCTNPSVLSNNTLNYCSEYQTNNFLTKYK